MWNDDLHLSDQQLLSAADGELPRRQAARVRTHLAACWSCRERMAEIESSIRDFVRFHRQSDSHLEFSAGSRALLRARLAELASAPQVPRPFVLRSAHWIDLASGVCAAILLLIASMYAWHRWNPDAGQRSVLPFANSPVPNPHLTPGATRLVTVSDVCRVHGSTQDHSLPASLQQKIFREYGIANARPSDYELDYLITPELGGSDDVRNLWPEPHNRTVWNSYVKDELENRLHQMVCDGTINLQTAQRDISTDWIAAYKRYFHTDTPLPAGSASSADLDDDDAPVSSPAPSHRAAPSLVSYEYASLSSPQRGPLQ